ncbi:MAG: RsiV family protein [Pasteurellaceae bacterium]|nr:RsiV family protein [Pasteurellaceae bacterium]
MKKTLIAMMLSSTLLLSACKDEESMQKLQQAQQQISQLQTDLTQRDQSINQLKADLDKSLKAQQDAENKFPALYVKPANLFQQKQEFSFKVANDPKDGDPLFDKTYIDYKLILDETGIDWLDKLLYQFLFESYVNDNLENKPSTPTEINELKQQLTSLFQRNYDESLNEVKTGQTLGSESTISLSYVGQRENLLTYHLFQYDYGGGAHGNYLSRYLNIDSNKHAILTLNDILLQGKKDALKQALWDSYERDHGTTESDEKGNYVTTTFTQKADFTISPEFYFNGDGLNFVYQPYELGPYAEGEITLTLYWGQLSELVKKEYLWNNKIVSSN